MSVPQSQMSQPPMTGPYGQAQGPEQAWGPPVQSQPVAAPPGYGMSPKSGHALALIGNVLIASGLIVLAFAWSTMTMYYKENPEPMQSSIGIGVIVYTVALLLIGVGFLIRSIGVYITATR